MFGDDFLIKWNEGKNEWFKINRRITFDLIEVLISEGKIFKILPNKSEKYSYKYILLFDIDDYIYAIPFVLDEEKKEIFLKTIIPSRKYTKKYLNNKNE